MELGARARLRAATYAAHEAVDEAYSAFDLASPEDYRRFLNAHDAVLPVCEAVLEASGVRSLIGDWPIRARAGALAADVSATGGTSRACEPQMLLDAAAAFGMLYVLEGSRMGGAVLARRLRANTDRECRDASRYLRHGEGMRLWPLFVAELDRSVVVREDIDAVVSGALAAFEMFRVAAVR